MRSKAAYILATASISFVLIGVVLLIVPVDAAGPYVLQIFGAMATIITVLVGLNDTDARVEVLKADVADVKGVGVIQAQTLAKVSDKMDDNTAVTEQTAHTLAVVSKQTAHALEQTQGTVETTHKAVNSRMDDLISTVKELAEKQKELAAAQALAQGIAIGREQTGQATDPAAAPPSTP